MGMNLIILLVTSWYMTGLIWVIQLVHYPSFHFIDKEQFKSFNFFHQVKITNAVMIVMILELLTSLLSLYYALIYNQHILWYCVVALLTLATWGLTLFYFMPLHKKLLESPKQESLIQLLVKANWWRTSLWSAKSLLLAALAYLLFPH